MVDGRLYRLDLFTWGHAFKKTAAVLLIPSQTFQEWNVGKFLAAPLGTVLFTIFEE